MTKATLIASNLSLLIRLLASSFVGAADATGATKNNAIRLPGRLRSIIRTRALPTAAALSPLVYLNTSEAYRWLLDDDEEGDSYGDTGDFYAMQKGCDAQVNQAYCGAATTACVLNSLVDDNDLPIDPAYAPYRYATDVDLLSNNGNEVSFQGSTENCVNETVVQVDDNFNGVFMFPYGLVLEQAAKLVECYVDPSEYKVQFVHVDESVTVDEVRDDVRRALQQENGRVFANFRRSDLGQVGGGHFSPIVGYNERHDAFLVYDVAKYKYPPVWASAANLHASMQTVDECGSWDFPDQQVEVGSDVLDVMNAESISEAAAAAATALGCEPAYRGYVLIEPTTITADANYGEEEEDEEKNEQPTSSGAARFSSWVAPLLIAISFHSSVLVVLSKFVL